MSNINFELISNKLSISIEQVRKTILLLEEGATIPFIARYRKEVTQNLDEVQIQNIKEEKKRLDEIDKRKETIINTINEQGKLTDELKELINKTYILSELEDIYLPYKPKKKTKALIAIENGLEPLAKIIMKQQDDDIEYTSKRFIKNNIKNEEEALQGARDIIAEWISENNIIRGKIRKLFNYEAIITSKVVKSKKEAAEKYTDYFDYSEPLKKCRSHRFLAISRAEKEGLLKVSIDVEIDKSIELIENFYIKGDNSSSKQVKIAIKDSYKRLIHPSIESEYLRLYKEKSDEEAIKVFNENLRQLLLQPPLGQKRILAIDPGYKTGCKIVCLDEQGNLIHNETIYPHKPQEQTGIAIKKILSLVNSCKVEAIAIGNGTAGRDTEFFIKRIKFDRDLKIFVVSEDGASIYSASSVAREEFPEYDVTVRGAISIGRRLIDPLAELVKIDPKSLGIGQYQYDVDQTKLKESLDTVVESCVNIVGVELNTASKHLLSYVAGVGPQLAQNIVDYRKENGAFKSREEIKKVKRLGDKVFEQCAGFLRIKNADNVLDNSAVHPESYSIVYKIAKDLSCKVEDLIGNKDNLNKIDLSKYTSEKAGLLTLTDIKNELSKPGRDPRNNVKVFEFDKTIHKIEDLKIGMVLPGIITNITNFGAFVDVGIKQNGLIHISNLADEFISNPSDVVKLHQHIEVRIIEVDISRGRVQLALQHK